MYIKHLMYIWIKQIQLRRRYYFYLVEIEKKKREILKGINLKINKGEVVALIGTNGSGKSTLLKLITKIIYPTQGKIMTNGKVTSLLELGAGFHPDFFWKRKYLF